MFGDEGGGFSPMIGEEIGTFDLVGNTQDLSEQQSFKSKSTPSTALSG
jgi:hypothetical protein